MGSSPGQGRRRGSAAVWASMGAAALLVATWSSAAQAQSPSAPAVAPGDISIALVLNDLTNPVSLPLRQGAQDAATKDGFKLSIVGPQPATAQGQIALLQDEETQGVNGMIVLPIDSDALVPAINAVVDKGIPVVTTELDAPKSKRSFFYFGGAAPIDQGKASADRVFDFFTKKGATGPINYVVTSCLPTVTGQQDRKNGFEQRVAELNATSPFQLFEVGFYDTTTEPAKNLSNIQNIYTATAGNIQLAYAMCGPDTADWGTVLKQNNDKNVLVAGYDWLPQTLDLIGEGWVGWAQGSSVYQEGLYTAHTLFDHLANGAPMPTGAQNGQAVWADATNLDEVRNSPDVKNAK
jgi:ABC-type sugar transport system substrate-binding protein